MGQTRPKIIALMIDKDLCFMFEPPKCAGMDDAVTVTLKWCTAGWGLMFLLIQKTATACRPMTGIDR
jgi:hypothetical protein